MDEMAKVLKYYNFPCESGKIICPFHAEKTPSLQVDIEKNFWYCFGCDSGGDSYKFHELYQNMMGVENSLEILKMYSKIMRSDLTMVSESGKILFRNKDKKDASYYRQQLIQAKDYYNGLRSVDWFTCSNECLDYMRYRGFTKSTLEYSGAKYTYDEIYPIVFPIMDNGKFKGHVRRTFEKYTPEGRKYLYNKGFRKKITLDGNYKNATVVMVVEGHLDYLKAKQHGVKNVVALLGWKASEKQIRKLKEEGVKVIISALDNDRCGVRGTKFLRKHFEVIRFPYTKDIKDIGEMSKKQFMKAKTKVNERLESEELKWD